MAQAALQTAEHLLPKAEIAAVRAVADFSAVQADALREVAAKRTNALMAGATEHEGETSCDPAKTLSVSCWRRPGSLTWRPETKDGSRRSVNKATKERSGKNE